MAGGGLYGSCNTAALVPGIPSLTPGSPRRPLPPAEPGVVPLAVAESTADQVAEGLVLRLFLKPVDIHAQGIVRRRALSYALSAAVHCNRYTA